MARLLTRISSLAVLLVAVHSQPTLPSNASSPPTQASSTHSPRHGLLARLFDTPPPLYTMVPLTCDVDRPCPTHSQCDGEFCRVVDIDALHAAGKDSMLTVSTSDAGSESESGSINYNKNRHQPMRCATQLDCPSSAYCDGTFCRVIMASSSRNVSSVLSEGIATAAAADADAAASEFDDNVNVNESIADASSSFHGMASEVPIMSQKSPMQCYDDRDCPSNAYCDGQFCRSAGSGGNGGGGGGLVGWAIGLIITGGLLCCCVPILLCVKFGQTICGGGHGGGGGERGRLLYN